ncbi:unnamed protein product [Lota lota]
MVICHAPECVIALTMHRLSAVVSEQCYAKRNSEPLSTMIYSEDRLGYAGPSVKGHGDTGELGHVCVTTSLFYTVCAEVLLEVTPLTGRQ